MQNPPAIANFLPHYSNDGLKPMMNKLLLLIALLLLAGCGSKKKITDFRKDYSSVKTEHKGVSNENSHSVFTDTTRTLTSERNSFNQRVTEKFTFDSDGNLLEYSKQTDTNNENEKEIDEKKGIGKGSTGTKSSSFELKSDSVGKSQTKHVNLNKKASNPVWSWLGFALFVVIVLGGIAIYFKFKE